MHYLTNTRRKTHTWYIFSGILLVVYVYLWYINPHRRLSFPHGTSLSSSPLGGRSSSSSSEGLYGILTLGQYATSSYRIWARTNKNTENQIASVTSARNTVDSEYDDKPLSYWHDLPLLPAFLLSVPKKEEGINPSTNMKETKEGINELPSAQKVNFICEIPRNTKAKYEVHKTEGYNPIAQDTEVVITSSSSSAEDVNVNSNTVKEVLRSYKWNSLVNYGAVPQTYEHPGLKDPFTDKYGDGDPIDIIDLCPVPCLTGEIYTVNVLGSIAMEDDGGTVTDYKIVSIRDTCPYFRTIVTDAPGKDTTIPFLMMDLRHILPTLHIEPTVDHRRITKNSLPSSIAKDVWQHTSSYLRIPFEENPAYSSVEQSSVVSNPKDITEWNYMVKMGPGASLLGSTYEDVWKNPHRATINDQLLYITNILLNMRLWFRDYKLKITSSNVPTEETEFLQSGGKMNSFSYNGYFLDRGTTERILHHTHHSWCILLTQLYYNILIEAGTIEPLLSSIPLPSLNQAIARITDKNAYIQSFITIKDSNPTLDTAGIISRPVDIQNTQDYLRQQEKNGKLSSMELTTLRDHHATMSLLFTIDRLFGSSSPSCLMYF